MPGRGDALQGFLEDLLGIVQGGLRAHQHGVDLLQPRHQDFRLGQPAVGVVPLWPRIRLDLLDALEDRVAFQVRVG